MNATEDRAKGRETRVQHSVKIFKLCHLIPISDLHVPRQSVHIKHRIKSSVDIRNVLKLI